MRATTAPTTPAPDSPSASARKAAGSIAPTGAPPSQSVLDPAADFSTLECAVTLLPDGAGEVTVLLDAEVIRRLRSRAQTMNLAEYIWRNIAQRAFMDHVY